MYLDSVYQRRRAESLFADLKSLDFATAGFPEVRDIMTRYGGTAMQPDLQPRFPDLGDAMVDPDGSVRYERPGSTCNPQNCTFLLQITTRLPRIPLLDGTAEFLYATLPYIGVRSWGVGAIFRIRNGKLDTSQTVVSELRMERLGSSGHRYLVPLGYDVGTRRDAASFELECNNFSGDYRVYVSHGHSKFPANMLNSCVVQSAGIPVKRAFDVHLRCFNNLFRSCRFDELAPSAWADYSANDGRSTPDPHK